MHTSRTRNSIAGSISSLSAKIASIHISRPKQLWAKFKGLSSLTGVHILVAEKQSALQTIQELKQQNSSNISSQGNAEFYSVENLKRRKALKRNPDIIQAIHELWKLVNPNLENSLRKDKFIALMIRLHCLMKSSTGDLKILMELAEEDWTKDAGGLDTMCKEKFFDSIFELIDIWTKSIAVEEYLTLANRIFAGVSILDQTGLTNLKVLKDVRDIKYDPIFYETEALAVDSVNNDEDLCWDDDLAVLQAQKARWEYDLLVKISKEKDEDRKKLQGASAMNIGEKSSEIRESELLRFTKVKGTHHVMIKPQKLMQIVAKIYDAKIVQDNVKELRNSYLDDEGGRFDKFVMLWHTQQFINKQRARDQVRLLLRSVKCLAWYHPRLRVFAKMVGIPIETPEGEEEYDRKFKPNATSQYLFPFFRYFLKTHPKTGQLERLEDWFGSEFAPKRVPKSDFLAAAQKTLKYVPYDSPKFLELSSQLESLSMDDIGWKQYVQALDEVCVVKVSNVTDMHTKLTLSDKVALDELEEGVSPSLDPQQEGVSPSLDPQHSNISKATKLNARGKIGVAVGVNKVALTKKQNRTDDTHQEPQKSQRTNTIKKKGGAQRMHILEDVARLVSSGRLHHHEQGDTLTPKLLKSQNTNTFPSTKKHLTVAKFVDIDWAVCLLLRVWDADYEWKQIITLSSAIVLIKRYIRRYKACKLKRKSQHTLESPVASTVSPKGKHKLRVAVVG